MLTSVFAPLVEPSRFPTGSELGWDSSASASSITSQSVYIPKLMAMLHRNHTVLGKKIEVSL
jgi:hypothetical protein